MKIDTAQKVTLGSFLTALALVFVLTGCNSGSGSATTAGGSALPDLAITSFSAPTSGTAGGSFSVTVAVANVGTVTAAGIGAIIALSPTSDIATDFGMIGLGTSFAVLNPGQSTVLTVTVNLPSNVANGNYYIGAIVPYSAETSKANNTAAQPFSLNGGSTCAVDGYETDNSSASARGLVFGAPQTHNHCDGTSDWLSFSATQGNTYTLSTSQVGSDGWTNIIVYDTDGNTALAGGSPGLNFTDSRLTWTAPRSGTFYARVMPTMGLLNAGAYTEYTVNLGDVRPDLVVNYLYSSYSGVQGGTIGVSASVRNQGFADLAGNFDINYYLSADAQLDGADTLLGTQTITGGIVVGASSSAVTQAVTIPAATPLGQYYILAKVNPSGAASEYSTANNVSVAQAINVVSANCSADSHEPDDSYGQAKPIAVGTSPAAYNHCLNGSDWTSFSATGGTSYIINVARVGGSANPTVQLYDTNGTTLLQPASGTATSITWTAPSSGTYYLLASDYAGAATDYTIAVNLALPDLTQALYTQSATSVVAGDFLDVTDTVTNSGYASTGAFSVGTYLAATSNISTADTLLASRNIANLLTSTTYSAGGSYLNQAYYGAHIPYTTTAGTYYIAAIADTASAVTEISESNNTSTPIAITVVAPPCAVDAYEDDDTVTTAKSVTAGVSQSRNSCDDKIDWVKFIPSVSGVYLASTGQWGPSFTVLGSDAQTPVPLQESYFYSHYSWNAVAGSTYYLKIEPIVSGSGTAYTLSVNQCVQDAFEEDDSAATAKDIVVGAAAQSRNHCEDTVDWATLNAVQGTKYTITGTNVGTTANVAVSLYDASGSTLVASGASAQGGKKNVITWTAPSSGIYKILADEQIGVMFGPTTDYTLQVQ